MQTDAIWSFYFFFLKEMRLWALSFTFPFQKAACSSGFIASGLWLSSGTLFYP